MTARERMRQFFKEANELGAKGFTPEQKEEMVQKARPIIEAACREQYQEVGAVFSPQFCLVCNGCPLGAIVTALSKCSR